MDIIHFTDLHYYPDNAFQKELIRRLIEDLTKLSHNGLQPDFIVFSGDLVNNPDNNRIYIKFEQEVLEPIRGIFSIEKKRVILSPGNHDVSWSEQTKRKIVYDWLQQGKANQAFLDGTADQESLESYTRSISNGFFDLAERWGQKWTNAFVHVSQFDPERICFVAINSAFSCSLDGSAADRGKLAVSNEAVLAAFHTIPNGYKTVSVTHHTFGDFTEATIRNLSPSIDKYASVHFFGHVHQARPTTTTSAAGKCFHVQGGALYERAGTYNGYSIVKISDKDSHVQAVYRSYYEDRHDFDQGTNVGPGGIFYSSPEAERYWRNAVAAPSQDDICYFLLDNLDEACGAYESTIIDRNLSDIFVEPAVEHSTQGPGDSELKSQLNVDDILKSPRNIVIGAGKEYGSSSLIRHIFMQLYKNCVDLPRASVPVLIDVRRLRSYEANVVAAVRGALPDTNNRSLKLQSLHDCGRLTICLDELDIGEEAHVFALRQLQTSLPKARLIAIAKMPILSADHVLPVVGVQEFSFVQIKTLNRGRIRKLVHKTMELTGTAIDQVVEDVTSRFTALGIPLTAPYVVIYLSVLKEDRGFSPINTSTVIESFVDRVLERYKPEYRFRSAFDYRDQVDYLSEIAENMCKNDLYLINYDDLYQWTKSHFGYLGIDQDFQKIIQFFILNKVFDVDGNCVFFRYNIFLSFFIASRMRSKAEFKSWIFEEDNYMRFISEIDIYCGLTRNDIDLLEILRKRFLSYDEKLASYVGPLAWVKPLENIKLPSPQSKESSAEAITRQLTEPNLSDEERDKTLDEVKHASTAKPIMRRPEVTGILAPWILSLRAYTIALKNLEAIPGSKKTEHLQVVLEGWATVMRYACLLFDTLIDEKRLEVGPMKFTLSIPDDIKASLLRRLFVNIPVLISDVVRKDLASQKLAVQLRDDNVASSLTVLFLQTGLYADMKLPEYITRLAVVSKRMSGSELFMEATLSKMRDIFVRYNISQEEQPAFRTLAAELSADVKGLKGQARKEHLEKYLAELRRTELIARLRSNVG